VHARRRPHAAIPTHADARRNAITTAKEGSHYLGLLVLLYLGLLGFGNRGAGDPYRAGTLFLSLRFTPTIYNKRQKPISTPTPNGMGIDCDQFQGGQQVGAAVDKFHIGFGIVRGDVVHLNLLESLYTFSACWCD
jgi:hypothetical protein